MKLSTVTIIAVLLIIALSIVNFAYFIYNYWVPNLLAGIFSLVMVIYLICLWWNNKEIFREKI